MASERPRRRRWRRLALALCLPVGGYGAAVGGGLPPSWPFDVVVNAAPAPQFADLAAAADGKRRLVVVVHGLWRSSAALGRLQRALRAHGYAVLPFDYPSTAARVEAHASALAAAVASELRPGDELCFVAHSLGGLVVHECLRRTAALAPAAIVYVAVPQRGAVLADLRKHWFPFRWVMGTAAALQLSPGDPLHQQPIPWAERAGVILGDLGPGNGSIPGPDDGTVAVAEAELPGARDTVRLPLGHTRIAFAEASIREVLHFLRRGAFANGTGSR